MGFFFKEKKIDLEKINKKVKKSLEEKRYIHTLGVEYTAASLAFVYDVDPDKAMAAGLLHDCAKNLSEIELLEVCKKNEIKLTKAEKINTSLLHAVVGAYFVKKRYHIDDEDIISAVRWHTTGKADMTMLEKIVFVADYIEPGRYKSNILKRVRKLAFSDIDAAVAMILNSTIEYVADIGDIVDETAVKALEFYSAALPKDVKKIDFKALQGR